MKNNKHPLSMTILFGLMSGILFYLVFCGICFFIPLGKPMVRFLIWIIIAAYTIILARWGEIKTWAQAYPLLLLLAFVPLSTSFFTFWIFIIFILSWIRSGLYFKSMLIKRFFIEGLLGFIFLITIQIFNPNSIISFSLSIWMFFLIQSVYFIFFEQESNGNEYIDKFEFYKREVEDILKT